MHACPGRHFARAAIAGDTHDGRNAEAFHHVSPRTFELRNTDTAEERRHAVSQAQKIKRRCNTRDPRKTTKAPCSSGLLRFVQAGTHPGAEHPGVTRKRWHRYGEMLPQRRLANLVQA